jgi:hypothetical protein
MDQSSIAPPPRGAERHHIVLKPDRLRIRSCILLHIILYTFGTADNTISTKYQIIDFEFNYTSIIVKKNKFYVSTVPFLIQFFTLNWQTEFFKSAYIHFQTKNISKKNKKVRPASGSVFHRHHNLVIYLVKKKATLSQ